jgi:hypothetical protein
MLRRFWVVALAVPVTVAVLTTPSGAAVGSGYVLDLQFNDLPGSTTAVDSSGMGHDGIVGSHVQFSSGNCAEPLNPLSFVPCADFDRHPPNTPPAYGFDHLIAVPDAADGSLDPGASDFSVEIRIKTKEKFGNVIQKGQSRTVGGQVKFQAPVGRISCMFKAGDGSRASTSSKTTLINDDRWHTVRCDRTQASVTMYVDGVFVSRTRNFTGIIDNKKPWTIGGKSECDQVRVTCDYFPGELDYVRMTKGYLPPL